MKMSKEKLMTVLDKILDQPDVKEGMKKSDSMEIEIVDMKHKPKTKMNDDEMGEEICPVCGEPMSEHGEEGEYTGPMPQKLMKMLRSKMKKGNK